MIVHQMWFGATREREERWMTSVRNFSVAAGYEYHCWSWAELMGLFGHEPACALLQNCRDVMDSPTTYAFATDWFRWRVLQEYGGIYLDTDFDWQGGLPDFIPTEDIALMGERQNALLPCSGVIFAHGERGQEAARLVTAAAGVKLHKVLGGDDYAAVYIDLCRRDKKGHGVLWMGVAPAWVRSTALPLLTRSGYSWEFLPSHYCSSINQQAMLKHHSAGSWMERGADWAARAAAVETSPKSATKSKELQQSVPTPPWLRPQSTRVLPRCKFKQQHTLMLDAKTPDGLVIPVAAKRIVILSNVSDLDLSKVKIQPGDHCLHLNRARQMPRIQHHRDITHSLIVRRGRSDDNKVIWYGPSDTNGYDQVMHLLDSQMRPKRPWWINYRKLTSKSPTTGFVVWHLAREATNLPVVLAGFDPGVAHGSSLWSGHAWTYEAAQYKAAKATIVLPG